MTSPARRQYLAIKQRFPDAVLLFRLGDFYEMFDDDAKLGAETLGITLTSREFARGDRVPMAGVPHHALQAHLRRFLQRGLKVAICEQLSEPGNGLVSRDVVRVVTPGTLVEDALLDAHTNNYLAAVNPDRDGYGLAYVDVSTGEFKVTEFAGPDAVSDLEAELLRLSPAEVLYPGGQAPFQCPGHLTQYDEYRFDWDNARDVLFRQFGVRSFEGFGAGDMRAAIGAAGAIVAYIDRSNRSVLGLLNGFSSYQISAFMTLDRYTRRSLELMEGARSGGARGSLLAVLDRTCTAMGGRHLRRIMSQPLLDPEPLERRLDAVEDLVHSPLARAQLRSAMTGIFDMERAVGRIRQGMATARDLVTLRQSLNSVPQIAACLDSVRSDELRYWREQLNPCPEVSDLVDHAIETQEGGAVIKPGFSEELDDVVNGIRHAREWIARLEAVERERTGIRSLKVGYNKVFGYYIEVSNANKNAVPDSYIRKQTLVNAERFITPALKEYEAQILQAEERISSLERRIFSSVLVTIGQASPQLFRTAESIAQMDVYRSLAEVAVQHDYCRPTLTLEDPISIVAGRHPVVEQTLDDVGFIANDLELSITDRQILIITGPNMGGKSTFLRQAALIVLMAQFGSFVPAERATIGLVDRIFSRVGAQDDIAAGQSTFMVEMVETANIVRHATPRSLLVLDEVGRGTSTYDGLAIARAVVEYIHDVIGARTLFATHYHELTEMADRFARIHNVSVSVAEDGNDVIFLHRVVPGGADRSYGVHVARLAGLPREITDRARETLGELEAGRGGAHTRRRRSAQQMSMFGEIVEGRASAILDALLAIDVNALTPIEALTCLDELRRKARDG